MKLFVTAILIASAVQLTAQTPKVLTNQDVVDMVRARLSDSVIVAAIHKSICKFSTDPQLLSAAIIVDTGLSGTELRRLTPLIASLIHRFTESDEVAVYRYDHFVAKLSDFTSDPQAIEKSFDAVKQIAEVKPGESEIGAALGPAPVRWILDRTQIGTIGAPPVAPAPLSTARSGLPSKVLHDAVFAAVSDLEKRQTDHRKIVILISDGQVAGDNEHSERENDERFLRNGIQFYAVSTDLKIFEHSTALNAYARETGGEVFDGATTAAMDESFAKLVEQARDQYVLVYVSSNELSGTGPVFRRIEVKAGDPKLKVLHRQGYLQFP